MRVAHASSGGKMELAEWAAVGRDGGSSSIGLGLGLGLGLDGGSSSIEASEAMLPSTTPMLPCAFTPVWCVANVVV